jgi:hypothetical protein
MRKSNIFLLYLVINLIFLGLMFAHASFKTKEAIPFLRDKAETVKRLELTDLCLFTEASYTRHLSQADIHTAFQDYPLSLEHFPSGSIHLPPKMIRGMNEKLD